MVRRKGTYLRLSVTDRCNLRCKYCRSERSQHGLAPEVGRDELLALVAGIHRATPLRKVRFTGGEPLVRAELPELVERIRELLPEAELCLTTNGIHLARKAATLRAAGLDRINVSVDTTDPAAFAALTRGGDLSRVWEGIEAAREAGFGVVKLNAVLLRTVNGGGLVDLVMEAVRRGCQMRFIELMPYGEGMALHATDYLSADEAIQILSRDLEYIGPSRSTGTAKLHWFGHRGARFEVGFITPVSHPFCGGCDRIRLDSRGRLFTCLRSSFGYDLLGPLREGGQPAVQAVVREAMEAKRAPGAFWPRETMSAIGG